MAIIPVVVTKAAVTAARAAASELALRAVRPAVCGLYRQDPGWYTTVPSLLGRDVGRIASAALDNWCDDQPLPPPRQVPFEGGQCEGAIYDVTFINTFRNGSPSTTFVRRRAGAIGGLVTAGIPGNTGIRYSFTYAMTKANPRGITESVVDATDNNFTVAIAGIVLVSGANNCGNPAPIDRPSNAPPSINFNVDIPDIRVAPTANIVVPVAIFKPSVNINNDFNIDFNMEFNIGGQKFIFDGDNFRSGSDITVNNNIDFSSVTSSISNSQDNIINNNNTNRNNVNSNINNNHTSTRNNINTSTSTSITNAQTNINTNTQNAITNNNTTIANNTNTSLATTQNNINNSTSNSITNLSRDINASLNILKVDLTAQLQFIANLTGIINADLKIALEFLRTINDKPECPELPPPVDELPAPPDEKPPDDGGDSPVKKRLGYVEIVLTKLPDKSQFGNRNAQNVYFAGWFAFRAGNGAYHPREQINFQRSLFTAPTGSDGYTYTLTHGASGIVKEYYV